MNLNKQEQDVLQLIKNDPSQYVYFFQKLTDAQEPYKWLEPLEKAGYFKAEKNPRPCEVEHQPGFFTIPKWSVLGYLENIAKKNSEKPNRKITDFLVNFIEDVIGREEKEKVDNWRTSSSLLKLISYLPKEKINEKYIKFVGTISDTKWKSTLVPNALKDYLIPRLLRIQAKDLLLTLLKIILNFKVALKDSSNKYEPIFERYWLKKTLDQHNKAIGQLCGVKAAEIGVAKIRELAEKDGNEFSVWRISCIENHEQRIRDNLYEYLIVDFIRDILLSAETEAVKGTLGKLLSDNKVILRRIAFHVINHRYNEFGELFWETKVNPLEDTKQKHEVYELLQNNCKNFTEAQVGQLLEWIETKNYYISDEAKENGIEEETIAWRKKEWLSACTATGYKKIQKVFEKYDKIALGELKHPGWLTWHESRWGRGKSPVSEEDLLAMKNSEIVQYINGCNLPEDSWDGPCKDGLVECLNKCVSKNPDKFCVDLEPFIKLERQCQQAILRGFCNARRDKLELKIEKVLGFMEQLIKEKKFWTEQYEKKGYDYRRWIISQIAGFVSDVLRDKDVNFEEELLKQLKEILLLLIKKTTNEKPENSRFIDSYINDSRGKVFEALVDYTWKYAQIFRRKKSVRWEQEIKNVFESGLGKPDDWCLYVTFGRYLPHFMRMDKNWTQKNITKLFPINDFNIWKISFGAYLNIHTLYTDLYELMKKGGHYGKAIKTDFEDEWTNNYLVQSISLAYMLELESLEKTSMMKILLNLENADQIGEVVNYVWTLREKEYDNKSNKVKNLWRELFIIFKKSEDNSEYQQIIINISEWLGLVDDIDEEIEEWVKFSIDRVNEAWELSFFVDNLLGHVKKDPKRVAVIYTYLLEQGKHPDFPEEKIIELVKSFYSEGLKQEADIICNKYLKAGGKFLIPIFEKYQPQEQE